MINRKPEVNVEVSAYEPLLQEPGVYAHHIFTTTL